MPVPRPPSPRARARLQEARVGHLGTLDPAGDVHLVPCCFAVDGDHAWSAVDAKPKRSEHLRRLDNIAAHGRATMLVDHYDDHDWSLLWWVRVSGPATVVDGGDGHRRATGLLRAKYPQYADHRLDGAVIALRLDRWRSWSADGQP